MIVERLADGRLRVKEFPLALLRTHEEQADCRSGCVIHNPSESHMQDWPLNWRDDRGMMERICQHGVGHPDIDQVKFWIRALGWKDAWAQMVHGCDGCCHTIEEDV